MQLKYNLQHKLPHTYWPQPCSAHSNVQLQQMFSIPACKTACVSARLRPRLPARLPACQEPCPPNHPSACLPACPASCPGLQLSHRCAGALPILVDVAAVCCHH